MFSLSGSLDFLPHWVRMVVCLCVWPCYKPTGSVDMDTPMGLNAVGWMEEKDLTCC